MEIELKFQVPAASRDGVQRAVATPAAQVTRMRAVYADTADDRLAQAGLALRLRQEGRRWVQTLKGRGDGLMQRLEHQLALPPQRGLPSLDPLRHCGSPAGQALEAALGGAELGPLYRTDLRRTHRIVRSQGARIEIAFDEGRILAGEQSLAVCEIEFELLSGPPAALLALAERWVRRHGLWLDVRTKSERGFRLARGLAQVPAVKAARPARTPAERAGAARLQQALRHLLPNLAELAVGSGTGEHLRQWRLAARRLHGLLQDEADRWQTLMASPSLRASRLADAGEAMRQPEMTSLILRGWAGALRP